MAIHIKQKDNTEPHGTEEHGTSQNSSAKPALNRAEGSPLGFRGNWPGKFKKTTRFLVKAALFLGPLALLPFGDVLGLGKEVVVGILVGLAFLFWISQALFKGEFSYKKHSALTVVVLLVLASGLGLLFAQNKYEMFFGGSGNFLCLFNILVLAILFWLMSTTEHYGRRTQNITEEEHGTSRNSSVKFSGSSSARFSGIKWFLWGAGLAILFSISQLFGAYFIPADFARSAGFNTVGTVNSVAILSGLVLAVCLGMLGTQNIAEEEHGTRPRNITEGERGTLRNSSAKPALKGAKGSPSGFRGIWLWLLAAVAGFYVLLAGYLPVWYGLIGASFIYFAQGARNITEQKDAEHHRTRPQNITEEEHGTSQKSSARFSGSSSATFRGKVIIPVFVVFLVAIVALSMNFVRRDNVINLSRVFRIQTPLEVSPSQGISFNIARNVYSEGWKEKILGSGWGSYSKKWKLYKKQDINWSQFWTLGFSQGASGFTTVLTEGGLLTTFLFVLLFLVIFWSGIQQKNWAKVAGSLFMFILWFFYPFNFVLWMAVFVLGAIRH